MVTLILIIYKTTNLINEKIYIGLDRKNDPKYLGSGLLLNKAIKKYGIENFKKEILEYCKNEEELNKREKYWIKKLDSQNTIIGYNIAYGGEGGDTYTYNPNLKEIKEKISNSIKGKNHPCFGKKHTMELKKKMGEKNKGNKYREGKSHSNETKDKLSKSLKGKIPWNKGKKNVYSKETIEKMRNAKLK